jgi:hypothetical protein
LGDNHPVGWLTVAAYLAAAVTSAMAASAGAADDPTARRERVFWWIAAVVMFVLAVNKQLDLQSLVTAIARCHAQLTGWYDMRRSIQRGFILSIAAGGTVALVLLTVWFRLILGKVWPAIMGLGFVCAFVVIRAASFHHVDVLIGRTTMGIKVNWLLELPGPIIVTLVALRRRRALARPLMRAPANHD